MSVVFGKAGHLIPTVLAHGSKPAAVAASAGASPDTTIPSAPLDLQATPSTAATALTWSPPSSDGGSSIGSYLVTVSGPNAPSPITVSCADGAPCTSVELSALTNSASYTFYVQADNGSLGAAADTSATVPAITGTASYYDVFSQDLAHSASAGVNLANGDLVLSSADLSIAGVGLPLSITRTFNSQAASSGAFGVDDASSIGPDVSLSIASGGAVTYHEADGSTAAFAPAVSGAFYSPPELEATLGETSGAYTLTLEPSGTKLHFNSTGRLTSEADRNSNAIDFSYNAGGTLASITDTQGRVLTVSDTSGRITSIKDPTGRTLSYGYDSSGDLTSYTDATQAVPKPLPECMTMQNPHCEIPARTLHR